MELEHTKQLASKLMTKHDLLSKGWKFIFDNARMRVGNCRYRTKTISISKNYIPKLNEEEVIDVLLHEIAHALVGKKQGHGYVWKKTAIEIGCNGLRLYHGQANVEAKYKGTCPTCGRVIKRHRRKRISCGRCSRNFDAKHLFVWTLNS
jgi:predicted SprT family Zn-dependent metalloprotease